MPWEDGTPATWGEAYQDYRHEIDKVRIELAKHLIDVGSALHKGDAPHLAALHAEHVFKLADDLYALCDAMARVVTNRSVD